MTVRQSGTLIALIHLGLVCAVAGKYQLDLATLPRAWVPGQVTYGSTGRYISIRICPESIPAGSDTPFPVRLSVREGRITVERSPVSTRLQLQRQPGQTGCLLDSTPYYVAEDMPVPQEGTRLQVQVLVPLDGLPRPLRIRV